MLTEHKNSNCCQHRVPFLGEVFESSFSLSSYETAGMQERKSRFQRDHSIQSYLFGVFNLSTMDLEPCADHVVDTVGSGTNAPLLSSQRPLCPSN